MCGDNAHDLDGPPQEARGQIPTGSPRYKLVIASV